MRRAYRFAIVLLIAAALLPAYLRAYKLSGASDIPTVLLGDTLIVNHAAYSLKLPYSRLTLVRTGSPKRGDFVMVRLSGHPRLRFPFFKRVMGLPGETIEMRENQIIVNGQPIPATALNPADFRWVPTEHPIGQTVVNEDGHLATFTPGRSPARNHTPVQLGQDEYFLLGDNRDNSEDSRYFGPVPRQFIVGKVLTTFATGARTK